jgi:type II secretory pathway pseudopilin PulG
MMMSPALERWSSNRESRNLEEIMGLDEDGDGDLPPRPTQEVTMTIFGMDDDLSTIAGDTLNGADGSQPRTPEKRKGKNGNGGDDDDDDTQPETPPKHNQSRSSSASKSYTQAADRQRSARFARLLVVVAVLGIILLGAIAALSLNLFQMRHKEDESSSSTTSSAQQELDNELPPWMDSPVVSPSDFSTPTNIPLAESTPSPVTSRPSPSPTKGMTLVDTLRQIILSASPNSADALNDSSSVQTQVFEWMSVDPSLKDYASERIVQRFALGVFFWSLSNEIVYETIDDWMMYTDECTWTLKPDNEPMCDEIGNVVSIYMEDVSLYGTLAPELGLLTELKMLLLASNNIIGELPSELGLLTKLEHLQTLRNDLTGSLPTEFGMLTKMGTFGYLL